MGRKKKGGGGMKGFVKQTRSAKHAEDASTSSSSGSDVEETTLQDTLAPAQPQSSAATVDLTTETKSQMRERHKKELNTAKKEAAKLGKKKKQEAATLVENIKARHEEELQKYKERNKDSDEDVDEEVEQEPELEAEVKLSGKKSKAQRRREKEAQRLEEREARIREDIAELGITDREKEEQQLTTLLDTLGYEIYEIRPDGHCLFKAIEDQLSQLSDSLRKHDPLSQEICSRGHSRLKCEELRLLAAEELRSHSEVYLPFFSQDEAESSFLDHCDKIESTAEWGGELEIQALSEALQRCMVIYSVDLRKRVVGEAFGEEKQAVRLAFMQHAYHLGAHYNSVRTK